MKDGTINRAISLEVLKSGRAVSTTHKYGSGKSALSSAKPIFDSDRKIIGVINNTRNIEELIKLRAEIEHHIVNQEKVNQKINHLIKIINKRDDFIFSSKSMEETANLASKVAQFDSTVMIYGE